MSTPFLDSLTFLSAAQRTLLQEQDLDTVDAFRHIDLARLEAAPFGFTVGRASKILAAARAEAPAPTVTVNIPEPLDLRTRIERALAAAEVDPSAVGGLADLGVEHVVLGDHGKVWPFATLAMRAHAATGAPVGQTWQGAKIVSVRGLSTPAIWCSPRTGKPLQDGKDEVTETPWGLLGFDGLRMAAFGYSQGMFDGMGESGVWDAVQSKGEVFAKIVKRMKALEVKPEDMDHVVVFRLVSPSSPAPTSGKGPLRNNSGSPAANLTALFLAMFGPDELRRFLGYRPSGRDFVAGLPGGNASAASFAHAAADQVIRHGWLTRDFRNALVTERPQRADEIDRIFTAAGVL